uniref:PKD/REJ-like domain-containing protein n=1 Tax=Ditylenchus dipsaci TaxID=166011 RepID=A0A915DLN6_9BILA
MFICTNLEFCEKNNGLRGLCICKPGYELSAASLVCELSKLHFDQFYIAGPESVELPSDKVNLGVEFRNPTDEAGHWQYSWELLEGTGLAFATDFTKKQLIISQLQSGSLRFGVRISNDTMDGYATKNLTVLPKKLNTSPKAMIRPSGPIFANENREIVLDGTGSLDYDGKIVSYENYTFELIVVDSRGSRDQAEVNIIVHSDSEHLPKATITRCDEQVTDGVVILRLPLKKVLLCGKDLSNTVDAVTYNWARIDNLHNLPVDYSGSSSAQLQLSNLHATKKVGPYEFRLKVSNAKQQSDVALVKIVVNEQITSPPEVLCFADWIGWGEGKIVSTQWKEVKGKKVKLVNANKPKASVMELEEGEYQFRFEAMNEAGYSAHSDVFLTVSRGKNTPPVARAENTTVVLPTNIAVLNGSGSSDDAGITAFEWKPMDSVPASLTLLGNSTREANLMVTNLVEGRFFFKLTVWDVSKKSHSTVAELRVKAGPEEENSVQIYMHRRVRRFSQRWSRKLAGRLSAALNAQIPEADTVQVRFTKFVEDPRTGFLLANFYAQYTLQKEVVTLETENGTASNSSATTTTSSTPLNDNDKKMIYAPRIVEILRREIVIINEFDIVEITTLHCFLSCSGHGICNNYTKQCDCNVYWMANLMHRLFTGRQEDCSWSILYVWLLVFLIISPIMTKLLHCCWMARSRHVTSSRDAKKGLECLPLFGRGVPVRLSPSVPRRHHHKMSNRRHANIHGEHDGFIELDMTSGMESDDTVFAVHKSSKEIGIRNESH